MVHSTCYTKHHLLISMDKLIVEGGYKLSGTVNISGSKNASLPILAASILTDEPVRISRVPDVSDTNYMIQILVLFRVRSPQKRIFIHNCV